MSGHVLPIRTYLTVFGALMVLTAVTAWVAYLDLGVMNDVVAMTVAGVKAGLVVLYFMHVRYGSKLVKLFAATGFLFLVIFFVLILADYLTRVYVPGWGS